MKEKKLKIVIYNNYVVKLNKKKEKKKNKLKTIEFKLGFERFKKEVKKRKKELVWLILGSMLIFIPISFLTLLQGKILDALIHSGKITLMNFEFNKVYFYLSIYIFLQILWRVADVFVFMYKGPFLSNEIFKTYSQEIFSKMITYPVSFFKKESLGKMTYTLNTGASKLSESVINSLEVFGQPIMTLFNMILLFWTSWRIGLVVLVGALFYALWLKMTVEKRKEVVKNFNDATKNISSKITENLNFAIEIKRNLKEKVELENLKKLMGLDFQDKFQKKVNFEVKNSIVSRLIFVITIAVVIFMMILEYSKSRLTEGDVLAVFTYSSWILWDINWFMKFINQYINDFTLIGDTEKLLSKIGENYSDGKIKKEVEGEIEYKNVSFEYNNKEELNKNDDKVKNLEIETEKSIISNKDKKFSLKNINLKIKKGQKVAFVGESGGGKSTMIELIGGFYFPTKGDVFVDQLSTKEWDLHALRKNIAYVSQDISIFNATIAENIAYGVEREVSQKEIEKAAKQAHIDEFIKTLPDGYKTNTGEKGLKLSGGQKQRIAIARAILRNPKILILDEPTSALDIKSETYITNSLKELMKGRTTIVIAHRISTVREVNKIFVFEKGKILEEGKYDELLEKKGKFAEMVELSEGLR